MKKLYVLTIAAIAAGLLAAPSASARGKKNRGDKAAPTTTVASDVYEKYDANKNAMLDADEKAMLLADFAKDTSDALLKLLDRNTDGKLGDEEIMAIPATKTVADTAAAPAEKKKRHKNK